MAVLNIDFTLESVEDPLSAGGLFESNGVNSQLQIADNGGTNNAATRGNDSLLVSKITEIVAGDWQYAEATIGPNFTTGYGVVACVNITGDSFYYLQLRNLAGSTTDNRIRKVVSGSNTNWNNMTATSFIEGDRVGLLTEYNGVDTSTVSVWKNPAYDGEGKPNTGQLISHSDTSPVIGGEPGLAGYGISTSATGYASAAYFSGLAAAGPEIDTVDDPIQPGANNHTVSGFGSTITQGSITSGTGVISFTSANDTSSTLPAIADAGAAIPFGTVTYTVGDGTDTAVTNTTYEPPVGFSYVILEAGFDTSENSFLYQYDGTPAIGDQFMFTDSITLTSLGGVSGEAGTYPCFAIDVSDTQPAYEEFDIILGAVGSVPVLSSPAGAATGTTTASGSVTTDSDSGTLYFLASQNASETGTAIKSGQSQAVSTTGVQNVSVTGLTEDTSYYLHYLHTNAGGDSNIAVSSQFTTEAVIAAPVLDSTKTLQGIVDRSLSKTLTIAGGDTATGWEIVGGADQANYAITDGGVLTRTTTQTVEESEVVEVQASNSGGTSGTQVLTVEYTVSEEPTEESPFNPYNYSSQLQNVILQYNISPIEMEVVLSNTLRNGSVVLLDGTEASSAEGAQSYGVINDLDLRYVSEGAEYGDVITVTVYSSGCIFNSSAVTYSDGPIDEVGKAALMSRVNLFK
jgi:hypothetical protein